ncbi:MULTISPECIES: translational GTPase TypA [Dietzia]|uniref:Large ribosomal subunit assembly factor BipA n=1 Tax=Dietzia cercidiphylli TaxID=498199 RepID=A0ABN2J7Q9_9ACTN|nr:MULTISPECIES: translational GTPase TypA [Dietzia]MBC7295288.1 translational GTPase TypA [Dietzia sp.]MBB1036533.1 translational GTPase TypA [Dietzia natronolimnaea]MBB1040636.1 translational GTPase TypA [Dietzia sp. Cai40]MBB1043725.1 translational GTPase TypA [Dietzia sp. DQ11-44]MBB1049154.1 translational GTPase TypA [Dietzia cercidiphylli]
MALTEFRNVAIVAHVDHGKTTLVDAMLRQSGAFDERAELVDRVMDSGDLEREKGITILAKNTSVRRLGAGSGGADLVFNIIDTPGHADFGGEVERGLNMVDGVVLLIDSSEGPLPQTRFVLRKALAASLPVIIVVNKTDRPDARIDEVVEDAQDLLIGLASDLEDPDAQAAAERALELPVVFASGRAGKASTTQPANGQEPAGENLDELFTLLYDVIPAPRGDADAPLQAHVTNLDASNFLGRIGLVRIHNGRLRKGQQVAWIHNLPDGGQETKSVRISELLATKGVERMPTDEAVAGDIVAVAGISDIMIGDTLADPENPVALPAITVDEPAISMTIGVNTSPLAGRNGGTKLTARMVKARLDQELVGNVSLKVLDTARPDDWEVQGRGEMALSILVETMRREGFELTVGKPQVVTRVVDGKVHEPMEHMTIDVPEEYLGAVTQLMAARKGRMEQMGNHGSGWVRMEFRVPARGLIGFRTTFMTETRGAGIANSESAGYEPWVGEIRSRHTGSLVADRAGKATAFALLSLADRGDFFIEPGSEVYEGVVVGENPRSEDMDVNITKEKKLTNMRAASSDTTETLQRARNLSLEEAMEFCAGDECVEVGPEAIRVRKVLLTANERAKARSKSKSREQQSVN